MKEKIRALVVLGLFAAAWYFISSLDVFYDLRDTDDLKKIESIIAEEAKDKDISFLSIAANSEKTMDSHLSEIIAMYHLDGYVHSQIYETLMFASSWTGLYKERPIQVVSDSLKDMKQTFKLEEIDFNNLNNMFNEAVALIPEGYENFHVGVWRFRMERYLIKGQDSEPIPDSGPILRFKMIPAVYGDFLKTQLVIQASKIGESKDRKGLTTISYYYEFVFETDHEGVWKPIKRLY